MRSLIKIQPMHLYGRTPSRGGKGPGYLLQSFFAAADKKRIFAAIPYASGSSVFIFCKTIRNK